MERDYNMNKSAACCGYYHGVQGDRLELRAQDGIVTGIVNDQTAVNKMSTVTASELQVGEQAFVLVDRNANGNLVARTVQVGVFSRPGQ